MCTLLQCVGTWDELRLTKRKEIIENGRTAKNVFKVGFPRDGTSRCSFVPGQGQEQKSRDKITFTQKKTGKGRSKTGKGRTKTGKDVLKQEKYILKQVKML